MTEIEKAREWKLSPEHLKEIKKLKAEHGSGAAETYMLSAYAAHVTADKDAEIERLDRILGISAKTISENFSRVAELYEQNAKLEAVAEAVRVRPSKAGIASLRETLEAMEAMAATAADYQEAGALRVLLTMHDKLAALNGEKADG